MIKALKYLKDFKKDTALAVVLEVTVQLFSLSLPLLMSFIINNGIANSDLSYVKRVGLIMVLVSFVHVCLSCCGSYFSSKTSSL